MKQILKTGGARKIFGRKEIEIVLKQLEGLSLTQSEKNRLSRDIRPKFDFIREISRFESEFELKKNQSNKTIMQQAIETILADSERERIRAILLFGSFADGTFDRHSDIDICVVFDAFTPGESTRFRIRLSGQLAQKVDLQVFNTLPKKIKRAIALNHKVLFRTASFDNVCFSLQQAKDDGFDARMHHILGKHT